MHLLLIEDDARLSRVLDRLLRADRHVVEVAATGRDGLDIAEGGAALDAIVLDIGLPGLDGYEVARQLRAEPALSQALLIALTGYGQPEARRSAMEAGFNLHLVKPVDPQILTELLRHTATKP